MDSPFWRMKMLLLEGSGYWSHANLLQIGKGECRTHGRRSKGPPDAPLIIVSGNY